MTKKISFRIISVCLSIMMLFTMVPLEVVAMDSGSVAVPNDNTNITTEPSLVGDSGESNPKNLEYNVWDGTVADDLVGKGRVDDPYLISNGAELMYIAYWVNRENGYWPFTDCYFELVNNIDMDMFGSNSDKTWTPIGWSHMFQGHFDGNGYEIINLNIRPSSEYKGSDTAYIGFFGFVYGGSVKNLGIRNYKIDYAYDRDTNIGTIAAQIGGEAYIENCYAVGEINATFKDSNPLDRGTTHKYTEVPDTLSNTNNSPYDNPPVRGEGVIIDLTDESWVVNKTMTIKGDVSAVRIIGRAGITYTGFNIVVESHEYFSLLIELDNAIIKGDSSNGTIYCSNGRDIFISSIGGTSKVIAADGAAAVNAKNSDVTVLGTADLEIIGGRGLDGSQPGQNGEDGHSAIICQQMNVDIDGTFTARSGDGGNGAQGKTGETGKTNEEYYWVSDEHGFMNLHIQTIYQYKKAGQGGKGGKGGDGGNGGVPITCVDLSAKNGTIKLVNGIGGNGGKGGTGGTGGAGKDFTASASGISFLTCYKPGIGGDGGVGGVGGTGGVSVTKNYWIERDYPNLIVVYKSNGVGGEAGDAGAAGAGGKGGSASTSFSNKYSTGDASAGVLGESGERGSDGSASNIVIENITYSLDASKVVDANLTRTILRVGGLVRATQAGYWEGEIDSYVKDSASVVNDLSADGAINIKYSYNTVSIGQLAQYNNGKVENSIVAYYDENGKLKKYDESTWFAIDNQGYEFEKYPIGLLTDSVDELGLVYNNDTISENKYAQNCAVVGYVGDAEEVVIPNFVFGGKFINKVTEIKGREYDLQNKLSRFGAFEGSNGLKNIVVGENVTKIGDYAFAENNDIEAVVLGNAVSEIGVGLFNNANNLESITIGTSLTEIPELKNGATPFGIVKSNSSLKEYIVASYELDGVLVQNEKFSADNGILYENFEVLGENLKVAVVDVPVNVKFSNSTYSPSSYIVRIYPYAFESNNNLKKVELDYIRDVGNGAFSNCNTLEEVVFGELTETNETVKILDVEYPKVTENYSTFVGISAFANCKRLHKVNLTTSVLTKIGAKAFENCATDESVAPLSINLGQNISSLSADDTELGGENYTPEELLSKGLASAFSGAKVLEFVVHPKNETFRSIGGVLFYRTGEITENGKQEVLWLAAYPRNAYANEYSLIYSDENDYVANRVCQSAFEGAVNLQKLTIGNKVEDVGYNAFSNMSALIELNIGADVDFLAGLWVEDLFTGCNALQRIEVDQNNAWFSDIDGVLFDKSQEKLIKYPQSKSGSEYKVPATVKTVESNAFNGNPTIRNVTFVDSLTDIGENAFNNCTNLSFIYFEKGDCPYPVPELLKKVFYTTNPRIIVAFGDEVDNKNWLNLSTEEANLKYYDKNIRLFQVAKYTEKPAETPNNRYYAVVVMNKNGERLNHINVAMGDEQRINTVNGVSMFYNLDFDKAYNLKVFDNQGEYFPLENAEFYLDEETRITYITLSKVPTVSGVNVSYDVEAADKIKEILTDEADALVVGDGHKVVDINSETAQINTCFTEKMEILVNCGMDSDVSIKGFRFMQGNRTVKTVEGTAVAPMVTYKSNGGKRIAELKFIIDVKDLELEQDVYVAVDFSDGNQVQSKLQIHIFELNFYNVDLLWFKNGLDLEISDELRNILKGFGQELSIIPKWFNKKTQVNVLVEPDSFKVSFGYGDKFGKDDPVEERQKQLKEQWDKFRDTVGMGKDKLIKFSEDDDDKDWKYNVNGFVELKYKGLDENGKKDFQVEGGISGTISFEYNFGTTVTVVVIPIRIELEVSAGGTFTAKLVFDREAESFVSGNLSFQLKGELSLSAGIGCRLISVGVYGSAEMVFVLNLLPNFYVEKWTLTGDVGAYFKYDGLFIKHKVTWSLLKGLGIDATWVIYEDGKWWFESDGAVAEVSELSLAQAMYDEEAYEVAPSTFDPEVMTFSLRGAKELTENAYSGIDPKLIQVGNLVYIVYHNDLNGYSEIYDEYNYQKIVYQVYNTEDGSFSDVYVLDDNGYSDGAFDVYFNGEDAVIVYSQLNKKLSSDNVEDIAGYVGSMEIKTAVLRNGSFVAAENTLTSDRYYDMNLKVGEINGKITAVWVKNAENTMFGTTDSNCMSIWYSVYENGAWTEPQPLKESINTITDIEIGPDGVVYITDTNNDLLTVGADKQTEGHDDRLLTVLDMNGNIVFATAEEGAYHDVSYFADEIVYYMGNNLYSIDTDYDTVTAYFDEAIAELPEDYTVLTDKNGNIKAILFVKSMAYEEEDKADASNIFAIFFDGEKWGKPIQMTDFGKGYYVSSYDAIDNGNEMLLSVLLSEVEFDTKTDDYSSVNRFETLWFEYPTDYVMGEISFDYESIAPDKEITFTVQITNNGYETLKNVPVSISRNGNSVYDGIASVFYDQNGNKLENGLLSGKTGYIKVKFNVGKEGTTSETLKYTVEINGQTDDAQLWYSDLAVYGKQVLIGNTYHAVVRVTNNGYLPNKGVIKVTLNGVELEQDIITDTLSFGESQYFTIPLEATLSGDSDLVIVSVTAENEYLLSNNQAMVNIATEESVIVSTNSVNAWVSDTNVTIDRSNLADKTISFEQNYSLESLVLNGNVLSNGLYAVSGNTITFNANAIAKQYGNGTYTVKLSLFDGTVDTQGNKVYRYAEITLKITQTFVISWVVDGNVTTQTYEIGAMPEFGGVVEKHGTAQYTYNFVGWDKELSAVSGNATYTAIFEATLNRYKVSFVVDSIVYSYEYSYGAMPEFFCDVTKESDAKYRYRFIGWDKVISPVTENVTYTAMFDAVLIGSAIVVNTDFDTAQGCEFNTTVSLDEVRYMTNTTFTIYYDTDVVSLISFDCYDGVAVVEQGEGYITISATGLASNTENAVIDLEFATSEYVERGETDFMWIDSDDNITSDMSALTIYEIGDVNMDGVIDIDDATLVQKYVVKKVELTDAQKVYANVNGDCYSDGTSKINTIDAALIQRFVLNEIEGFVVD